MRRKALLFWFFGIASVIDILVTYYFFYNYSELSFAFEANLILRWAMSSFGVKPVVFVVVPVLLFFAGYIFFIAFDRFSWVRRAFWVICGIKALVLVAWAMCFVAVLQRTLIVALN